MPRLVENKAPVRRSSRQVSAAPSRGVTPDPTSAKSRTTTKRKRVVKEEPEDDDDIEVIQEEPRKPARKPPSRQASTSAKSASGRKTRNIEPIEEEPEDKPSPPKRSRRVDSDVEDDEEEVPSTKKTKPAARTTRKAPVRTTKPKRVDPESEPELDDAIEVPDSEAQESSEEEKPKRRGKAVKGSVKAPSRVRGKGKIIVEDEDEEERDVPVIVTKPVKEERLTPIAESRSSSVEVEEQVTPRPNRIRQFKPEPPRTDTEPEIPSRASNVPEDEEEQEKSLLEPTPPPQKPLVVPPPIPEVEEPKGPVARLVIHKMVLNNFKSYAGKQIIGPFHKSFSAIVGPNGSGKSNTIDALLFVFGYRASKMRQGKLSELIHNSANFPDLDECSVEVHFREIIDLPGPDAFEAVPNSDLAVARIAYRNNSSKYTINGHSSNFTEVTTLLKGRGIDLDHKRFLILQGEVESIAQMKPKAQTEHEDGLLEYLEDIIGTSRYKEPIEQALVELDALAETRTEKLNRLRIVEREKNALEEKKREAEDFLRLQNDHVKAQSRLYQWYLWKCFQAEQQYNTNIEEFEHELEEERERNKDDIEHCKALEQHYKDREEAYEEVKRAATEAKKELAENEKQLVNLEERKKHESSKQKKLTKSLQEDKKARDEAKRFIEENTEKMAKNKKKLVEFEDSLTEEEKLLEKIRDSLKDKTQVFHDQIEVKQRELQPWTAKINAKQSEIDVAVSERDTLAKKAEAIKTAYVEAQSVLEQLQSDHETKTNERGELLSTLTKLQKDARDGERKLQDMEKRVQDLRAKASSSRQKVDEAKASQAASTSQNKVLDSLTRLSQTGRISGFHGRLGSLGTIPEKYDVAISTAAPALNNLVVDTVEQGQACIEYLRKQSVGRASFIVLEKLSQTHGLDKIATPENVPRLIDLIKPKEQRFAPAFFKAVGNTLVANDLEQANRIAFGQKRWRVVTLTGQLIDTSGTMSGGGNHVARGAMSSKLAAEAVQPEVMRKYEKDSEEAGRQLNAAQDELRGFESQLDSVARQIPQVQMDVQKIELDIKTGATRIADAEKRVRDLKSQTKPDKGDLARISTLEAEIESSTAELESVQAKAAVIEKAIKDLEKKILDIGGAKLLTQKSKVDGIKLHINLAMEEITKAEVNKAKAEKDTVKFENAIEKNKKALNEVESDLAKLNEEWEECSEFVNELQSKVDAAQHAADNAKDDLENLKSQLDEKTAQIQEFRAKEMEITQKLKDIRKEKTENDKLIKHYSEAHDTLKLEDIDDDEDEGETNDAATEAPSAKGDGVRVKEEPTDDAQPKKRAGTPSNELHVYTVEELSKFRKKELLADVTLLEEQVKNANPNLGVLKEYRKREQEFLNRAKDLDEVTAQRDAQKAKYDGLRKQRLDEFMTGFSAISAKLKEMYQMITLGGNAELELVDSMDPFSEGIIFSVMPPKKSWKNISNLSGGEKTLSSLALVFALHVFKPTPLYFMDEIDAALDFRNVSIVANYIKDRTKNAQFIIISLRNDMFELSHRLIGIYKTSNTTKSIAINNHALRAKPINVA